MISSYKFDEIAYNITAKRTPCENDMEHYIGLEHLETGNLYVSNYGSKVPIKGDKLIMKTGDILLGKRNAYLRRAAIAPHDGLFSAHGMILRPKIDVIDKDFFPFFIASDYFFDEIIRISVGGLSPTINWKDLKELRFNLPSLEEQKALANKLWAAYSLKESYKRLIKATDEMVKSQFIEMFKDLPINGKIKDLVERNIASVKKSYQSGDEIEYIDISSIDNTSNTVVETTKYEVASAPSRAQQCVKNGDILVSTVRPINRNIAVVTSNLPDLVASTGFCILRPKDGYREYLHYVVKSDAYTERMCDKASGGLYPAVNNRDVLSYGIHIPNKELAQKVSSIYQQADKSKFTSLKSQFIEMFKNTSLVRLGDRVDTQSGGTPNTKKSEYYDEGSIPWLSSGEINQGYISSTEKYITEEGLANSAAKWVPKNSVVIAMYGATAGKVGFITIPLTTNQAVCALLPNKDFDPLYLYYAVASQREWMIAQCRGAAQPNISQGIIRSMEIPMPSINEQIQFADIIKQADKSKYIN